MLILDEPANGRDPAGIRWMRGLLRDYADRGGTVLLSSHLLHEIEVVADDLVVIGNGRIVAQGAKSDLLRDYADRGGTVLLSSHLLHEIEVIADDLVVIGNGRIVAQGAKHDLLRSHGSIVRTADRDVVARALTGADVTFSPVGEDGFLADADAEQVGKIVFAAGIPLTELRPAVGTGLEELFLELTAETQRDTGKTSNPQGATA